MFFIYNFFLIIFGIFSLPCLLIKRRLHREIFLRFYIKNNFLRNLKAEKLVWLHGASVGEISASKPLIESINKNYPGYRLVISTITKAGNILTRNIVGIDEIVIYFPFDLKFIVESFLDKLKPDVFILLETEIWPNFIYACKQRNIPILLLNGRISDRAFKRYLLIKDLLKVILDKIDLFCMQDEENKSRILALGAPENRIFVTGNIKFDIDLDKDFDLERLNIINEYLKTKNARLIVAGSTHPNEENKLLGVFKRLKSEYPYLFFLIAPRHIERSHSVRRQVSRYGFKSEFYSRLDSRSIRDVDIIILDEIGKLRYLYKLSDIVFIGGSLIPHGGQNPIEPAFFGKPVIFGLYMDNFREITRLFLSQKAALQVQNEEELFKNLSSLLNNPEAMKQLGENAKRVIDSNRGVTDRLMKFISPYLNRIKK